MLLSVSACMGGSSIDFYVVSTSLGGTLYAFYVVSAYLGGTLDALLCGPRIAYLSIFECKLAIRPVAYTFSSAR